MREFATERVFTACHIRFVLLERYLVKPAQEHADRHVRDVVALWPGGPEELHFIAAL